MKRLGLAVSVLIIALVGSLLVRVAVADNRAPLVVVHWSNSHPMREGLLPEMVEEFNHADNETASGQPIEIQLVSCDSSDQIADLDARLKGAALDAGCQGESDEPAADPTVVTPQSDDWLVDLNHRAGQPVIDLANTQSIAETYLGIVTYRAMAECLGWPEEAVGYSDLVDLFSNPEGWRAYPDCAWDSNWGTEPLLAFTNPSTSTSGRNVLVSLYAMAAGDKAPADLTVADVKDPDVVASVREFQQLVDHYMPGTIPLNTKIAQGTSEGHFFLMPEDNLVNLQKGNEKAIAFDGTEQAVPPVDGLVMMYPEEGSVLNSNPAALVDAAWVSDDEVDAARAWIEFLREDKQQNRFMAAGFRPASGTDLAVDPEQFEKWGLAADQPQTTIEPGDLSPDVLQQIVSSWGSVKKPSIVTFVVDVSGSMEQEGRLEQAKKGLGRVISAMSGPDSAGADNQVGLVTFASEVIDEIPPAPLEQSKYDISEAVKGMKALGNTALYDAVRRAVELTDQAPGDAGTTRAVVVLSDGAATAGGTLDQLVSMRSDDEVSIASYGGQVDDAGTEQGVPIDELRREVPVEEVNGVSLLMPHDHDVQVFFLGFGESDIQVGRILAEATGAEYQGQTDEDLAAVIEALSGYF